MAKMFSKEAIGYVMDHASLPIASSAQSSTQHALVRATVLYYK